MFVVSPNFNHSFLEPFFFPLHGIIPSLVHSPNPEHMTTIEAIRDRRGACQRLAPRNILCTGSPTRRKRVMGYDRALGSQSMTSDTPRLQNELHSVYRLYSAQFVQDSPAFCDYTGRRRRSIFGRTSMIATIRRCYCSSAVGCFTIHLQTLHLDEAVVARAFVEDTS
jgi:hypothetical protein